LRLSARESCMPRAGGLGEVDVDVVEDFDVVAEEADGLEDDGFVAGFGEALRVSSTVGPIQGRRRCPGLEGEEPVGVGEAHGAEGGGDGDGGVLALDGIGVGILGGAVVLDAVGGDGAPGFCSDWAAGTLDMMVRQGTAWAVKRMGTGCR
jgi:hypothetical protein